MIDLEELYFEWLLTRLDSDGVHEGVAYLCGLLHGNVFRRRVGNDVNRAADGANLRKDFLTQFEDADFDPHVTNYLLDMECTWLEMLIALASALDYLYDGGVEGRFLELCGNLGFNPIMQLNRPNDSAYLERSEEDQEHDFRTVEHALSVVDNNEFDANGNGGIFPLRKNGHPDQREVEIWDQHAAYFRERLEGVLWTSTN